MSETNCMTCMIGRFKDSLCDNRLCKKYARNGSYDDFEKFLLGKELTVIVRCKDCEYWYPEEDDEYGHCRKHDFWTSESWYCADGERKEDGKQ